MSRKVLVVDDIPDMREIIVGYLETCGYPTGSIIQASDGQEGYEAFREHRPYLLLTDNNMPRMDGIELLRKVADELDGKECGRYLLTGKSSPELEAQATEVGATLIGKPFNLQDFREKVVANQPPEW